MSTAVLFMNVDRVHGDKSISLKEVTREALYELAAPKTPAEVHEEVEKLIVGEVVTKATVRLRRSEKHRLIVIELERLRLVLRGRRQAGDLAGALRFLARDPEIARRGIDTERLPMPATIGTLTFNQPKLVRLSHSRLFPMFLFREPDPFVSLRGALKCGQVGAVQVLRDLAAMGGIRACQPLPMRGRWRALPASRCLVADMAYIAPAGRAGGKAGVPMPDDNPMPIGSPAWAEAMAASLRVAAHIAEMDDGELAGFRERLRADPAARETIAADLADAHRNLADMLAVIEIAERRLEVVKQDERCRCEC